MNKGREKTLTLLSVSSTFFIDFLSWSIVFPIFAPYFLRHHSQLFSIGTSLSTKVMFLGFFLAIFSFGQFIGAPLIGEYADKHGRKKALLGSVFLTFLGLCLTAYSMQMQSLFWIFIGRLITGFFSGSTGLCFSCMSDLSETNEKKIKNFGILSVSAGLAFILGTLAGGYLSDRTIDASLSLDIPIWGAAGLCFLNFVFIFFSFRETFETHPNARYHFFESFQNIYLVLKTKKIKRIYMVYFLFFTSWITLFQYIPVIAIQRYSYTSSNLGNLALFMGVFWIFGSGYLGRVLPKRFDSRFVLEICLIAFAIFSFLIPFFHKIPLFFLVIALNIIFSSIAWPIFVGMISNMCPQNIQGKVMGLSQSIQSLAMAVGPLIGGFVFRISLAAPFIFASLLGLLAILIYLFMLQRRE